MNDSAWTRWIMNTARTWNDISFIIKKTGIEMVDNDHRRFVELALEINQFIDMMYHEQVDLSYIQQERELLQALYEYAEEHFQREQDLINHYKLEGLQLQKEQHRRILSMLQETVRAYQAGRLTITLNLKSAILEWVAVHINQADYETFKLEKWRGVLHTARTWDDLAATVRHTGVTWIDEEHRALTELTLKLNQALRAVNGDGSGEEAVDGIERLFDQVRRYVGEHFAHEERFLREYQIPGGEVQEKQHERFLNTIAEYRREFRTKGTISSAEFELAVLEWWINHINEVDYNSFSMEKWGHKVIELARTWEQISWLIRSMGVEEVDEDHRRLVEIGLELSDLIEKAEHDGDGSSVEVVRIFQELFECAKEHFAREEDIMKERGLPGLEEHHEEHEHLLEAIQGYRQHFEERRLSLTSNLKIQMMEWWINHTNGTDYIAFCGDSEDAAITA